MYTMTIILYLKPDFNNGNKVNNNNNKKKISSYSVTSDYKSLIIETYQETELPVRSEMAS